MPAPVTHNPIEVTLPVWKALFLREALGRGPGDLLLLLRGHALYLLTLFAENERGYQPF